MGSFCLELTHIPFQAHLHHLECGKNVSCGTESRVGLTGDEQNLSTDVLNVLEEVIVVKVGHMLRIRGADEGLD